MAKIKARGIAIDSDDFVYVVDDDGQIWVRGPNRNAWESLDLPDAPRKPPASPYVTKPDPTPAPTGGRTVL